MRNAEPLTHEEFFDSLRSEETREAKMTIDAYDRATGQGGAAEKKSRIEHLLRGAVDLHCHSGPSIMRRALSHLEAIREAEAAGMRAILFKDHYYDATPVTQLLDEERFAKSGFSLFSGVPLNNALGGLNPYAVEHGLKLGARLVWMPTLSAMNHHRRAFRYDLAAKIGGKKMLPDTGISVLTDQGQIKDEAKFILDLIARHDAVLSGGHLHISEMWALFVEAKKRGVSRMLVSHPTHWIDATLTDLRDLGKMGVFLEHCACQLIDCPSRKFTAEEVASFIEAGTVEQTILGSDLGQPANPRPVEGFRQVIALCMDLGYADSEIAKMVGSNACRLLGIEQFPAGQAKEERPAAAVGTRQSA